MTLPTRLVRSIVTSAALCLAPSRAPRASFVRSDAIALICVIGLVVTISCRGNDDRSAVENTATTQQAVTSTASECRRIELVASRSFPPNRNDEAERQLSPPLLFAIPADVVAVGDPGVHPSVSLEIVRAVKKGKKKLRCVYERAPAGDRYSFASCDDGSVAGTLVTAKEVTLAVDERKGGGKKIAGKTVVRMNLEDAECSSCDDGDPCTLDERQATGCVHTPAPVGTSCSDGNACNGAETCNASGACTPGAAPTIDDANPCTIDSCDPASGVKHVPVAAGTSCSDGDVCNGDETCNAAGACVAGTAPALDDGNPCTTDSCDSTSGVKHTLLPAGSSCSDGNACNGDETCDAAGTCAAGTSPKLDDGNPCTVDTCDPAIGVKHTPAAAGTSCSDGNACNGDETCDGAATCVARTAPPIDDANPCTIDSCSPTGGVVHVAATAGTSCSDGDVCNGSETCDGAGKCTSGAAPAVDDGNPCTTDSCDPAVGVKHTLVAAGTSCSDGNACNGAETCSASGSCVAGTALTLDDGNPCTTDTCDPTTGVKHVPVAVGTSCSDGNACNGDETCSADAKCLASNAPDLDDGNPCTTDTCSPTTGVKHTPVAIGTSCSDGNACNGVETCNAAGACVAGSAPTIDDGDPCTVDACDAATGVTHVRAAAGTSCSDGNACNGEETCNETGACIAGTAPTLDDGNPCTVDTCSPATGVTHSPAAAGTSCSDGDACNGAETCDGASKCVAGLAPTIDDGNPCTTDTCDPSTGVKHVPVATGTSCSDGDACNGLETCNAAAACVASSAPALDDGNPCTVDTCDPATGVKHTPAAVGSSCSDGNACNGDETCSAEGACDAGTPPAIDDGNPCTTDSCDPASGVKHVPVAVGTSCSDGDACNGAEACSASGTCAAGAPPTIDDGNPCTIDSCDAMTGVKHMPVAEGTSCSDGNACNGEETCNAAGTCLPGEPLALDDENPCTVDTCDPVAGVKHTPLAAGGSCSDADPCNGDETCDGEGGCVSGGLPELDDHNPCTADLCDSTGVRHAPMAAGTSCSDGNPCNGSETCDGFGHCAAEPPPATPGSGTVVEGDPSAGSSDGCVTVTCSPTSGFEYTYAPVGTPCTPIGGASSACTSTAACDGEGSCVVGPAPDVDDGNECTVDSCDASTGVRHVALPAGTACGDNSDPCAGHAACTSDGTCIRSSAPMIDDGNPCTIDSCSSTGGVQHVFASAGTSCSDGNACNGDETCDGSGKCSPGKAPNLDDGNPCTTDACSPTTGITHVFVGGACAGSGDPTTSMKWAALSTGRPSPRDGASLVFVSDTHELLLFGGANAGVALFDLWAFDRAAATWSLRPEGGPASRAGAAVVYDRDRKRVVLFGGVRGRGATGSHYGDTWEYAPASRTWSKRSETGPSPRAFSAIAYDEGRRKTILFGGSNGTIDFQDTWEWDGEAGAWSARTTTSKPPARGGAAMVLDATSKRAFLFGGAALAEADGGEPKHDLWQLDVTSGAWSEVATASHPPARLGHALVLDPVRRRAVLFGGTGKSEMNFGDVWELDLASAVWSSTVSHGAPRARAGHAATWDDDAGAVIVFGGLAYSSTGMHSPGLDDVWSYRPASGTWSALAAEHAPAAVIPGFAYDEQNHRVVVRGALSRTVTWELDPATGRFVPHDALVDQPEFGARLRGLYAGGMGGTASLVYDVARKRTVLIGSGRVPGTGIHFGDPGEPPEVWEWNGSTWQERIGCSSGPRGLAEAALTFDPSRGRAIVFGGVDANGGQYANTWELDVAACRWEQKPTWPAPSARGLAQMAWDSDRNVAVLFGGRASDGWTLLADTWEWNGTTWTQRVTSTSPPARRGAAFVYDRARKKLMLFGGSDATGVLGDTWELDPATATWTPLAPTVSPTARRDASFVYDPHRARMLVYGGRTATGAPLSDLWEFDGSTWRRRMLAASPGARTGASAAWNPRTKATVLFGGVRGDGERALLQDTWLYADGEWRIASSPWPSASPPTFALPGKPSADRRAPPSRAGHALAMGYSDSAFSGYGVLFGGEGDAGVLGDTWLLDDVSLEWEEYVPAYNGVMPVARSEHAIALLPGAGYLLFGGRGADGKPLADTWTFTRATGWKTADGSTAPSVRHGHALAVDTKRGKVVLFGGRSDPGPLRDTWEWDIATRTWAQKTTTTAPPASFGHRLAFDASRDRVVLTGGVGAEWAAIRGDVWEWDGTEWRKRSPLVPLTPRVGHVAFVDDVRRELVVFGGHAYADEGWAAATYGDTWRLENATGGDAAAPTYPNGTPCTGDASCESGLCVDGVCCNSACSAQCGACDVPGKEGTCSAVTGSVHGSRPSCGATTPCGPQCDGTDLDACHPKPAGAVCAAAGCTAGTLSGEGTCDSAGACVVSSSTSCEPFACHSSGTKCQTSCGVDSDCFSPQYFCAPLYPGAFSRYCFRYAELTSVTFTPSPAVVGSPVTIQASSVTPELYQFSYTLDGGERVFPCGDRYVGSSSCTWTPSVAGTYTWLVEAKSPYSYRESDDSETVVVSVGTP